MHLEYWQADSESYYLQWSKGQGSQRTCVFVAQQAEDTSR